MLDSAFQQISLTLAKSLLIADRLNKGIFERMSLMKNIWIRLRTLIIPLKYKLITGFAVILILMGGVSLISFFSLRNSIGKLNLMIETTITANRIIQPTTGIPADISNYYMYNRDSDRQQVLHKLDLIKKDVVQLQKRIQDEEGMSEASGLASLCETYHDDVIDILNYMSDSKTMETDTFFDKSNGVKRIASFIKDSVQQVIALELNHYNEVKAVEDRRINLLGIFCLIMIFVVGVLSVVGAIIFSGRIAGTISKMAALSKNIANGDLQAENVVVSSNDEISSLAQSFNKMQENLRELIGKISDSSGQVAQSSDFLKKSAEQSAQASEQIALTIQEVSKGAAQQSEESQKTVQVITNLLEVNRELSEGTLKVLAIAENAVEVAVKGNDKVRDLINQINVTEKEISATQEITEVLKRRSEEIGEILGAITQISEQTNLLSLNAAIEAARAGEYGKGFAVVADEVRKLADGSARGAQDITKLLEEIQNESLRVADRMVTGVETVKLGTAIAQDTQIIFEKIVDASKEAEHGMKDIAREIQGMVGELNKVVAMSESIAAIAEQSSAGSQEVAASAQEQTASLEEILGSASVLTDMAAELKGFVQRFKL